MNEKIINQLRQFKCYHFEEWQAQSNYIPLAGEICGFIILNDEELKGLVAQDLIPNGYEGQKTPYTLMKMGDGITPIMELPWAGLTDENVVNQLIDNLFKTEGNENAQQGIIGEINKHIAKSVADWDQNDPEDYSFIKNRICSAVYEPVPEDTQITLPELQINMQYEPEILKAYFGSYDLEEVDEEGYQMFHEMDKYEIGIYNPTLQDYSYFLNSLTYIGNASTDSGKAIIYGFGNTASFGNLTQIATNQMIEFTGEVTSDPYGLILIFITNPDSLERYCQLLFYCDETFVAMDATGKASSLIKFTYKEKCISINPISSRWLPQLIKAHADWNALSYEDPGFIKNRICSVIAYENATGNSRHYLKNQLVYFTDNLILSDDYFIIPNFGPINALNKYKLSLNDQETISQFFEIQSINKSGQVDSDPIYLLGNTYLYVKFLYDLCVSFGTLPLFVVNLMSSIEDNGLDFCFLCTPEEQDLAVAIMYRPDENKYKGQKNIDLSYTLTLEGSIALDNNNITRIIYDDNIFEEIKNNTNHFLNENNEFKYYIVFEDKGPEELFEVVSYGKDANTNKYYIELDSSPGYMTGNIIPKIHIIREDAIKYVSFSLEYSPLQIKTIDPVWIPAELKVGQYENYNAYDISAEIFNDYNGNHAYGAYSHAEGRGTIANGNNQHVQGQYNIPTADSDNSIAFIVGNGSSETERSNAYSLDFKGNSIQSGSVQANEIIANGHKLTEKENSNNKVKTISYSNTEEQFPTSQAVIDYFNSIFFSEIDDQGNITLNIGSIDSNGLYGNPFIDK